MELLSYIHLGKFYDKYLSTLKKYYYIKGYSGFNMSMCPLTHNTELYCIRVLGLIPAYFGDEIIPGNYSTKKEYMLKKLKKEGWGDAEIKDYDWGKNFFWNAWTLENIDNTIFFVGHYENEKLTVNENIKPYIIHNKKAMTVLNKGKFKYSDVRLINNKGRIYCYDTFVTSIYEIIVRDKIYISINIPKGIKYTFFFLNKICYKQCTTNKLSIKLYDKNWAYVRFISKDIEFLNWFENGYVTNTIINSLTGECTKKKIIKMKNDIITGLGTIESPMFSFGTPFIKIINNDSNVIYDGISVGHIKIIRRIYNNDKINQFINKFSYKLGKNYIKHNSYMYLCYFIRYKIYKNGYKLMISDSFVPYTKSKIKYKFSIFFPMGIIQKDDKILVSAGEGDFYNIMLEFDYNSVINNISHDIENFDISSYNYNILETE